MATCSSVMWTVIALDLVCHGYPLHRVQFPLEPELELNINHCIMLLSSHLGVVSIKPRAISASCTDVFVSVRLSPHLHHHHTPVELLTLYHPHNKVTINEAMIPFKGHSSSTYQKNLWREHSRFGQGQIFFFYSKVSSGLRGIGSVGPKWLVDKLLQGSG